MSFVIKRTGASSQPVEAEYTCPEHGTFSCDVIRDHNGDTPDAVGCPIIVGGFIECDQRSTWTPSRIDTRVRKVEVVRGKWEKPERPTYYNTQALGEGQDIDEWRADRAAKWDEQRKREVYEMAKDA